MPFCRKDGRERITPFLINRHIFIVVNLWPSSFNAHRFRRVPFCTLSQCICFRFTTPSTPLVHLIHTVEIFFRSPPIQPSKSIRNKRTYREKKCQIIDHYTDNEPDWLAYAWEIVENWMRRRENNQKETFAFLGEPKSNIHFTAQVKEKKIPNFARSS